MNSDTNWNFLLAIMAALALASCGEDGSGAITDAGTNDGGGQDGSGLDGSIPPVPDGVPTSLSEWQLFDDIAGYDLADDIVAYNVIAPLFTDDANKPRAIRLTTSEKITFSDESVWEFPVGTILIKTFGYPDDATIPQSRFRRLETRLLVHRNNGWAAYTYVWNDEQTEATLERLGRTIPVTWTNPMGDEQTIQYLVPTQDQCQDCHRDFPDTGPLGPSGLQLNRDNDYGNGPENQIDYLASLGMFETAPPPMRVTLVDPTDESASISDRARAYLHSNCGHCHSEGGNAAEKTLRLLYPLTDPSSGNTARLGICISPSSFGDRFECDDTGKEEQDRRMFDVVPGDADKSLMICRMESTAPEELMPPIGRSTVHGAGVELVREWINALPPAACSPE